jgi:putative spermidine/putrescine transport system permease protein
MFQSIDWGLGAALSVTLVVLVGTLIAVMFRFLKPAGLVR